MGETKQKRYYSMASTLSILMCVCIVGASLIVLAANVIVMWVSLNQDTRSLVSSKLDYYEEYLTDWVDIRVEGFKIAKSELEHLNPEDLTRDGIYEVLKRSTTYALDKGVLADYFVFASNGLMSSGDGIVYDNYDARTSSYYNGAVEKDGLFFSRTYVDAETGDVLVTMAEPFYVNGSLYGVLCRDITVNEIANTFSNIQSKDGTSVYLLDRDGYIYAHRLPELAPSKTAVKNIDETNRPEFYLDTKNLDSPANYTDHDGTRMITKSAIEPRSEWVVGVSYPTWNFWVKILVQCAVNVGIFIIISTLDSLAVYFLLKARLKPIKQIVEAMDHIKHGVLDTNIGEIKQRNEIGLIADSFVETQSFLNDIVTDTKDALELISKGDLTVVPHVEFRGKFGEIKQAIHDIVVGLKDIIGKIESSSALVASGSQQVASNSMEISSNVVEQNKEIEALRFRIDSISEIIKQNVEECSHANEKTNDVTSHLEESSNRMSHMVKAMEEITNTSEQIKKINKTIEDMAMQTNILSINASVEASHAGSHGKGFAVVAEEVNSFANQCSAAAVNTESLVTKSITSVNKGSDIANETAAALQQVVSLASEVTTQIDMIVNLSAAQSDDIDAIRKSVEHLAAAVNHNVATAEEGSATSEELSAQAYILQDMLKIFKTK